MKDEIALAVLHTASRPENMAILGTLRVDVQASFLELRSGCGLSNEGLRRRLEDLQRYRMIKGGISPAEKGVRVTYGLTDLGDRVYRLVSDSLDCMYEMDTKLASNRFVLDAEAFQEIVRISGIRGMRRTFARSKIMLRKADHIKLEQNARDKKDPDVTLLLSDSDVVSIAPAPSKDKTLTRIEQHLRKAKRLSADHSDLIVTAIGLGASLITDNTGVQSAARSMGVASAGSTNVSYLPGPDLLQDVFYEASIGENIAGGRRTAAESKHEILRDVERTDAARTGTTSSYAPLKEATASESTARNGMDHNTALDGMNMSQKDPRHAIRSEEEYAVYERLAEKNPYSARKFLGALLAFRQDFVSDAPAIREEDAGAQHGGHGIRQVSNPDKFSQSAHSIREMLNILLRGEAPALPRRSPEIICQRCGYRQMPDVQRQEVDDSNRDRMRRVFGPPGNLPDHFGDIYDELYVLHKWFTGVSHDAGATSESEYRTNLARHVHIMHLLLNPHFDSATQIDDIARMKNPKIRDLERVREMIRGSAVLYSGFFTRAGAEWLKLLAGDGRYFRYVTGDATEGYRRSYAALPEFGYLERAAASEPSETLKIISGITIPKKPSKQNPWIIRHLVRAGAAMPPKHAKEVAQMAIDGRWHCAEASIYHIADLARLMVHVSTADIKVSLKMCAHLLDVTEENAGASDPPAPYAHYRQIRGRIDVQDYKEIIKKSLPLLADIDNDAVLTTVCDKLKKSICIENKLMPGSAEHQGRQQDMSNMWRPTIEDWEQNGRGVQSLLVECVRDLLERSEKSGVDALKASLSIIASYRYPIFRRMEVYIYARNPEYFSGEINKLAVKYFDDCRFKHEYHCMLRACYGFLTDRTRGLLMAKISNGPARDEYLGDHEMFEVDEKKRWRIEKLDPIIEHLPEHKREYEAWIKKHGRPSTIDSARYTDKAPYKTYEPTILEDFTPKQMIKFLRTCGPRNNPRKIAGLRSRFRYSVGKNPVEYAKLTPKILLCSNEFHSDFLDGLAKAHDKYIDWRSVLRFCADAATSQDNVDSRESEHLAQACANILRFNLRKGPGGIPHSMRKRVWRILEHCTSAIPRDGMLRETYRRRNESILDAMTTSINSTTGVTAHAIVQYAVWHHNNVAKDSRYSAGLLPEVRSALDSLLDPNHPQSVSAHAALGYGFAGLFYSDKKWATENIGIIFAHDELDGTLGDAAWDSYMTNVIYEDVFYALRQEYEYRIRQLSRDSVHTGYQERLAQQVGVAYLHSMRNSTKILELFVSHASAGTIGKCLETIVLAMSNPNTKNKRPVIEIKDLIKYKKIRSNPKAGWLFVPDMVGRDGSIRALNRILEDTKGAIYPLWRVTENLESCAGSHPLETIQCIEKIVRGHKNNSEILLVTRHLETIFDAILTTNDTQSIRIMKMIVDSLGRIGLEQFKRFA